MGVRELLTAAMLHWSRLKGGDMIEIAQVGLHLTGQRPSFDHSWGLSANLMAAGGTLGRVVR